MARKSTKSTKGKVDAELTDDAQGDTATAVDINEPPIADDATHAVPVADSGFESDPVVFKDEDGEEFLSPSGISQADMDDERDLDRDDEEDDEDLDDDEDVEDAADTGPSEESVRLARRAGVSESVARSFPSTELLLRHIESQVDELETSQRDRVADETIEDEFDFKLPEAPTAKLDDDVDPAIKAHLDHKDEVIKKLVAHNNDINKLHRKALRTLAGQLRSTQERTERETHVAQVQAFDAWINNGAPSEVRAVLGKGRGSELQGKPEFQRRSRVYNRVTAIREALTKQGEQLEDSEIYMLALNSVYGKKMRRVIDKDHDERVSKRNRNKISRPTAHRRGGRERSDRPLTDADLVSDLRRDLQSIQRKRAQSGR